MVATPTGLTSARAQSPAEGAQKRGFDPVLILHHNTAAIIVRGVLPTRNNAF